MEYNLFAVENSYVDLQKKKFDSSKKKSKINLINHFGHFFENFHKKKRFVGSRSPSKLVYIGAFRKILGSVTKYGYLKIEQSPVVDRGSNP